MAKITNAFTTAEAVGNREDLSEAINMISPEQVPMYSDAEGGEPVKAIFHEWQTDALAAPDTGNAHIEGDEESAEASTPTVRVGNYCQISKRTASVSNTQEKVKKAGRKSDMNYNMTKRLKELKLDIASIMCANQGYDPGPTRKTRGLESWLETNSSRGATGADAASPTVGATDGTQRPLTEVLVKASLQASYSAGGEIPNMYVGPFNKGVISGFTGRSQARQNIGENKIQAAAHVYASDFGDIKIKPNRFQRERTAFLLDPEYYGIGDLRPTHSEYLGVKGDAREKVARREWCVIVGNEGAHAVIADLDES